MLCTALSVFIYRLLSPISQLFRLDYCAEQFTETANISFQCTLGKLVRIDSQNNQKSDHMDCLMQLQVPELKLGLRRFALSQHLSLMEMKNFFGGMK